MKKKEKLRRLTAAAAAALTLFFSLSVYAQAEDEKSPPLNEAEVAETVLPAPERVGEIESLRKKNSRTYEMSDGSYECVIYAEDVNYEDESGKLVGIDNSLIADTEYAYKNKANSWNAYFPEFLTDEKGLCVKRGDYSLSFSIFSDSAIETVKEADVFKAKLSEDISEAKITEDTYYEELSKDNRSLVYENEAVDFAYTVKTGYLKEDIILKRHIPGFEVNFLLKLKGIAAEQEESAVIFRNEAGEEVFKMLPMYMEDSAGNYSEDVHYSLKEHEDGYILTVTPDEAFLENAEYPVKIDPTVTVTGAGSTSDTCVDEQYPASNYYSRENLWTGGALGTNAMRTYIRFSMPAGVNSTDINSATLRIKKREHSDPTAAIYPVDYDWDSRVITWNNKPSYNGNINLGTLTKDSGAWFKADLTTCTKNFISGAWTNYGIVLKEPSETNSAYKTKYYSSDAASPNKPELVINYKGSTTYYGTRPYQSTERRDVNCMGYALEYAQYITGDDLGFFETDMAGKNLSQFEKYISDRVQIWTVKNIGTANFKSINTYDSDIDTGWYRIVLRVGFVDDDHDGVFDMGEEYDYHFWYQTKTGNWADKLGGYPSCYRTGTVGKNPVNYIWNNQYSAAGLCYNSPGKFFQIKDTRTISW